MTKQQNQVRQQLEKAILQKAGTKQIKGAVTSSKFESIKTKFNGGKTIKLSSILER